MLDTLSPWVWLPLLALLSAGLIGLVRHWLLQRGVVDMPNARSNHAAPVVRGGGMAMVPLMLAAGWLVGVPWVILALTAILAALCGVDDVRGLPARLKLGMQLAAVVVAWLSLPPSVVAALVDSLGLSGLAPGPMLALGLGVLLVPCWVWWVNGCNFLDGIDGITALQVMTQSMGILLLAPYLGSLSPEVARMAGVLLAVYAGFLIWNWHPASLFLGDSGSVPTGFLTGFLLLMLAAGGAPVAALLLAAYTLVDTTATLLLRAARNERLMQAHSLHAYQRAVRRGGLRHDQVVLRIAELNALLLALSYFSLHGGWIALLCLLAGYMAAVGLWLHLGGGWRVLCQNPAQSA